MARADRPLPARAARVHTGSAALQALTFSCCRQLASSDGGRRCGGASGTGRLLGRGAGGAARVAGNGTSVGVHASTCPGCTSTESRNGRCPARVASSTCRPGMSVNRRLATSRPSTRRIALRANPLALIVARLAAPVPGGGGAGATSGAAGIAGGGAAAAAAGGGRTAVGGGGPVLDGGTAGAAVPPDSSFTGSVRSTTISAIKPTAPAATANRRRAGNSVRSRSGGIGGG